MGRGPRLQWQLVVVAQPALVPAQPLREALGRHVEGGIGLLGGRLALGHDAPPDMDLDRSAQEIGIAGEDHRAVDGVAEILAEHAGEAGAHMLAQGVAHIDLLAFDDQLHLM